VEIFWRTGASPLPDYVNEEGGDVVNRLQRKTSGTKIVFFIYVFVHATPQVACFPWIDVTFCFFPISHVSCPVDLPANCKKPILILLTSRGCISRSSIKVWHVVTMTLYMACVTTVMEALMMSFNYLHCMNNIDCNISLEELLLYCTSAVSFMERLYESC
jgi:hypothetical protein